MCVADSYWCDYYCKYAPSWYYGLVAKGEKACPIDPSLIDPLTPVRDRTEREPACAPAAPRAAAETKHCRPPSHAQQCTVDVFIRASLLFH